MILRYILKYCNFIGKSIERFGDSFEVFDSDEDYHSSVCMHMLQIGELVGRLSTASPKTPNTKYLGSR